MRSNIDIKIENTKLDKFCYLESTITEDNSCIAEINRRLAF